MKLHEYIAADLLAEMIAGDFVRTQDHPTVPLRIYNYTQRTQWDRVWNDATEKCRGLIVNTETQEVVARPFRKFFNYGEAQEVPAEPFEVFDKLDGSLGVLYWDGEGHTIATRGAFESPQAKHATELIRRKYGRWCSLKGLTYLFEIIYPENKIVVNYGDTDDLFLLAVIETETGRELPLDTVLWPGPRVEPIAGFADLPSVVSAARPNAEGFVLRFASGFRLKVKHAEYVRLHKLLTGISNVTIWEMLSNGLPLDSVLETVPDEFFAWVRLTVDELQEKRATLTTQLLIDYEALRGEVGINGFPLTPEKRKAFALAAAKHEHRAALFSLLDGKGTDKYVWKVLRPERCTPFMVAEES